MSLQEPGNIDSRWKPWIGSWRLVSNTVNSRDKNLDKEYRLEILPGSTGDAVVMKAFQEEKELFKDRISANGLSQPLRDEKCSGWYRYSWSDTGKRLLFESESSCSDSAPRTISGLSVINKEGEWLDIQLIQNDRDRIITLRRYEPMDTPTEINGDRIIPDIRKARLLAGTNFSINEIIELSGKVPSEILEAALLEYREPFNINSKNLVRLAKDDVPEHVIDLMVALSFPDKFIVERDTVSHTVRLDRSSTGSGRVYYDPYYSYYSCFDPYFPWCWTPSTYAFYWNSGWGFWGGYYPSYPIYIPPGGGIIGPRTGSGRLVAGHGYTKVSPAGRGSAEPRYADERYYRTGSGTRSGSYTPSATYSGSGSSGSYSSGSSSGSSSSGSSGSYSSGSSSGSSSSGSSGSYSSGGGGSPSASPGGYSSGGGGRGSARPR